MICDITSMTCHMIHRKTDRRQKIIHEYGENLGVSGPILARL